MADATHGTDVASSSATLFERNSGEGPMGNSNNAPERGQIERPAGASWRTTIAVAIGALAGCSTTASNTTGTATSARADDCFFASTLSDWRPLDNENLILFTIGHEPYHVQLNRPAFGLDYSAVIGVYDRDGRICPYGGDSIIVDGSFSDRVTIRSLRELDDSQLQALYVAHGIEPPTVISAEPVDSEDGV
jgi:hypothetical protein